MIDSGLKKIPIAIDNDSIDNAKKSGLITDADALNPALSASRPIDSATSGASKPVTIPGLENEPLTPTNLMAKIRDYASSNSSGSEEDAAKAIANVLGAGEQEGGRGSREDQQKAVANWAEENGLAVSQLPRALDYNSQNNKGGAEHDVWFDPKSQRWVKVTKPSLGVFPGVKNGKWTLGPTTPAQYLEKLNGLDEQYGVKTPIHGVLLENGKNPRPSFIVSQPNINGNHVDETRICGPTMFPGGRMKRKPHDIRTLPALVCDASITGRK